MASDGGGDFDATNLKIFVDEGNDTWDGTETEVSYIDDLGEDETVTVFVFGDIPRGRLFPTDIASRKSLWRICLRSRTGCAVSTS